MFYFEFIKLTNNPKKKKSNLSMFTNTIVTPKRADFDRKSKIHNKNLDLKPMLESSNFSQVVIFNQRRK